MEYSSFTTADAAMVLKSTGLFKFVDHHENIARGFAPYNICRVRFRLINGLPVLDSSGPTSLGWDALSTPVACSNPDPGIVAAWLETESKRIVISAVQRTNAEIADSTLAWAADNSDWERTNGPDGLGRIEHGFNWISVIPASDGTAVILINDKPYKNVPSLDGLVNGDQLADELRSIIAAHETAWTTTLQPLKERT
ncbi:hypothetical protein [Bifidobacterium callitrichidarum]|uniref:Uncharacterized protein n=1 Tax=Bifidobacterium callitrichidarum TaxID=2052941 RepID=A0A2U2N986_9BIFI|nr:hypothetical protein [Bifidobacterium callitrichidarum]PWG65647.1 hypothetical protein DF196_06860 [Bifidobacterium callitrichidarum]